MKDKVRINRYLASTGVASRRGADDLILQKRVSVNRALVEFPGLEIDPMLDVVEVDQKIVKSEQLAYRVLNKPRSVITTLNDPQQRPTVKDFIEDQTVRLFPVGRLDFDVAGVLLLTNDGELTHKLLHPKFEIKKVYLVELAIKPTPGQLLALTSGVQLNDGFAKAFAATIVPYRTEFSELIKFPSSYLLELTVTEGRKHFVKKLIGNVGLSLISLSRVSFGEIKLQNLALGRLRELTSSELSFISHLRGRAVWFSSSGS